MARTVEQIQVQIESAMQSQFNAIGIDIDTTKWSKRNMLRLLCFVFATVTAYIEQLMDAMKADIELSISKAASTSSLWVQKQMFLFQYSDTTPQVLKMYDAIPQYDTVDSTLRIITACSVKSYIANIVTIKVAKSSPFEPLSSTELAAAQNYINQMGSAGIVYNVISESPDKIYINANIYYQGQYASTIKTDVVNAINDLFLTNSQINFDGTIKIIDIEKAILSVNGVQDVTLLNVKGRSDSTAFIDAVDLILNSYSLLRAWTTISGYAVAENSAGHTLDDSLTFIAQ